MIKIKLAVKEKTKKTNKKKSYLSCKFFYGLFCN